MRRDTDDSNHRPGKSAGPRAGAARGPALAPASVLIAVVACIRIIPWVIINPGFGTVLASCYRPDRRRPFACRRAPPISQRDLGAVFDQAIWAVQLYVHRRKRGRIRVIYRVSAERRDTGARANHGCALPDKPIQAVSQRVGRASALSLR